MGNARKCGEEAAEKLKAKPVDVGRYDLVLHPSHLWLTIHESIGHPTELDRAIAQQSGVVLDEEAGFGTGLRAALERWHGYRRAFSATSPRRPTSTGG